MDYVIHLCKNSHSSTDYCDRVWIDEDRTNAESYPPTWKYCPECEKKGFKNPKRKNLTDEQRAKLAERLKKAREAKKKWNTHQYTITYHTKIY